MATPFYTDEYGNLIVDTTSNWVNEKNIEKAVQKVLAFRHHKAYITAEDVLNILIDTECISESDLKDQMEEYKKEKYSPAIPKNYLD